MTELPEKPSELLKLALDDLEAVEQNDHYDIDMETWHEPSKYEDNVCSVCLAGAVLVNSLDIPQFKTIGAVEHIVRMYGEDIAKQLDAIDSFRCGLIPRGVETMGYDPDGFENVTITPYEDSPSSFKRHMRNVIDDLQAHDL